MKKFRSSKLLKPVDLQTKEQGQLRSKIKILEEQIQMLQKSNLNIFIPLSEHIVQPTQDYDAIIRQLRVKIGSLQNQNQAHKFSIKKLEREKQHLKKEHYEEIKKYKKQIQQLEEQNQNLSEEVQNLRQKFEEVKRQCESLEQSIIQKNVELKFTKEELHEEKVKNECLNKKIKQISEKIEAVLYGSRIHKSLQLKLICLPKEEYDELKSRILILQAELDKLRRANYRQMINLGTKKSNIGEQIVRLKKNIDLQLGLEGVSKHSQDFLKIYKGTQQMFDYLLKQCKT